MALSLRELMNTMIAKQGYLISPQYRQILDLKNLVNDMYSVRNASGSVCTGHSGTTYTGKLSLGDINSVVSAIKACSCHTVSRTVCDCQGRTGGSSCDCYSRSPSCSCYNRTAPIGCTCNSRDAACGGCHSRTSVSGCQTVYDDSCQCFNRTTSCQCVVRTETCTCLSRTGEPMCQCYGRSPTCDCQSRSGGSSCDCDSRDSACGCQSRTGTSACNCDGRCSCQAVKEFS